MDERSIPGLVSPSIRSTISLSLYLPCFHLCIPPSFLWSTPPFSKHLLHPQSLAKALQLPECIHESGNHRIDRWCASLEFQSAWPAAGTIPFFCLANGRLNESGSGISRLICVASKLPEKARRDEPGPAQLHAFCSQDYDTREIYAHIIWDVVQRGRERWGMGRWETGRWGHSWMRESPYNITTDATPWSLTRNESSWKFKEQQSIICAYVCDMLIVCRPEQC